jgi:hypothetical protein
MSTLTDQDVHEIALVITKARERIAAYPELADVERALFDEAECRLGRSLPPVNATLIFHRAA